MSSQMLRMQKNITNKCFTYYLENKPFKKSKREPVGKEIVGNISFTYGHKQWQWWLKS